MSSITDFEEVLAYDASSNIRSLRLRNGAVVNLTPDNLNRVTVKDLPGTADDVYYSYDNFGRLLSARHASPTGSGITTVYDAAGWSTSTTTYGRTVSRTYDLAGNMTTLTHPDGFAVQYLHNVAGQVGSIRDSSNTTLATYTYDDFGRRTGFGRGSGISTGYGYDSIGRLQALTQNLAGTNYDATTTFTYTPASQIHTRTQTNDAMYTWSAATGSTIPATPNGLNQLQSRGSAAFSHDALGNPTNDGSATYGYDNDGRMRSASSGVTLEYDPSGTLRQLTNSGGTTDFLYDGPDLIAEYRSGAVNKRYIHGMAADEPIAFYDGASSTNGTRRYYSADERGSIIAFSNNAGTGLGANKYSPDGDVDTFAGMRFGYTGQVLLASLNLYYYKARMYSPKLGRFMQPDPIRYADGMNMYAYAQNDPVNAWDPSGLGPDDPPSFPDPFPDFGPFPGFGGFFGPVDPNVYNAIRNAQWRADADAADAAGNRIGVVNFLLNARREIALSYGDESWALAFWNVTAGGFVDAAVEIGAGNYRGAMIAGAFAFFPELKAQAYEKLLADGFELRGRSPRLKWLSGIAEKLIELDARPGVGLHDAARLYPPCEICGRLGVRAPDSIVLDRTTYDPAIPIQRVRELTTYLVISSALKEAMERHELTGAAFAAAELR